jgi:large subunit ribosomal protein L24
LSSKASKVRKRLFISPLHIKSARVSAHLSDDLKSKYSKNSIRVRKGDTVKVLRGAYEGVEGKIQTVNIKTCRLTVEGITREKIAGGTTPVEIHVSKVMIVGLNLDDKLRKQKMEELEKIKKRG